MKKVDFLNLVKETLEISDDTVGYETNLGIDSMGILGLIALYDEHFNVKVKALDLKGRNTINKLIELTGQSEWV